jgi:hypothetical protein
MLCFYSERYNMHDILMMSNCLETCKNEIKGRSNKHYQIYSQINAVYIDRYK